MSCFEQRRGFTSLTSDFCEILPPDLLGFLGQATYLSSLFRYPNVTGEALIQSINQTGPAPAPHRFAVALSSPQDVSFPRADTDAWPLESRDDSTVVVAISPLYHMT